MKGYLSAALLSFVLSFVLCLVEIPLLRRLKAGQNILGYVKEHQNKSGTPTMGGLAFILAACIVPLIFYGFSDKPLYVSVAIGLGFMIVGFLDDFLKLKHKENLGLKVYQKIVFQLVVAVSASMYCYLDGLTLVYIPFTDISFNIGWGIIPLGIFVFLAAVNSVNLTDGLDGLASSSSIAYFLSMGLLILLRSQFFALSTLCFCLTAALAAYLVFNTNRASVFMGDTGSLSLGGFVACVGIFSGNLLYIAVIGAVFVLSSITVIIQVIYYKKTGKRVFKMAPIHHHFQEKGYSESKISYCYGLVTLALGALSILALP
ncbi:MAG: phospho-N-acetylmuramoyl-pentapeptide-transferase [Clostridia bacterium]|nr:phospho-N-acetylmuramoyl-pentapeptide-transferase [Clostridia bacterium]